MAKKDDFLTIEWDGLKEIQDLVGSMSQENIEKIVMEEMTKYGLLVEEGSKALVQYDTGDLEQSINFGPAKREGNLIVVEGGSNLEYALRRHEEPYRMGKHPKYDNGAKFPDYYQNGRGRGTRKKPTWRGYPAGRKFISNAMIATEKEYDEMNARILERILGGDES